MGSESPKFEQGFIQKQRHRLMKLREELMHSIQVAQGEQTGVYSQSVGEAHEFEDDAQKLTMLENERNSIDRNRLRLRDVERALQKIEDGTYGLSDASGESIPLERLEAVPEALYTVSELKGR